MGCTMGKYGLLWVAFPLSLGVPWSGRAGPVHQSPFPLPSPDITEEKPTFPHLWRQCEMSSLPTMQVQLCLLYFNKKCITQSSP